MSEAPEHLRATDMTRTMVVNHTPVKVLGWVCFTLSIFCTVMSWRAGGRGISLVFLFFAALGGYVILSSGSMHVDSYSIRYYLPFRSYQIKWTEIRHIEVDSQGATIVFVGENKKLAVHGPMFTSGKDKREAGRLIATQMDKYGIEFRLTEKANYRFSRNTRVPG